MQPQRSPVPKNNLDDAFKSLEQLLHVLQEATTNTTEDDVTPPAAGNASSEAEGNDSVFGSPPIRHASAAAGRARVLSPSPSAASAGGSDLEERTPKPRQWHGCPDLRSRGISTEFNDLIEAAEHTLFSPVSGHEPSTDFDSSLRPFAWREDKSGSVVPSADSTLAKSMSTEELTSSDRSFHPVREPPSSERTFLGDHEQEQESGSALLDATLRGSGDSAVVWPPNGPQRFQRHPEEREVASAEPRARREDKVGPMPIFARGRAAGCKDASVQCDTTSAPRSSCEEEMCRLSALVQAGAKELSDLKRRHEDELGQMRALLGAREEELAALKAQHREQASARAGAPGRPSELQIALREKEEEALKLASELQSTNFTLSRLQNQQEKELEDCAEFLRRLALSSSTPALGLSFDLSTAEVLGAGNYGYIFTCRSKGSGDRVVVKLQSVRWAGVAVKEWAHGSQLSGHSHIVSYIEAIMHRDANMEIENHLKAGFDNGILTRRRPKFFPDCYFCLALEYMDRGTVQHLLDRHPLTPESVGAITRQVASALAFMHKRKRTHNDIKPENILLREAPSGDCLVAKLADLGLADHSSERKRDQELFGYTVWCMGMQERFHRCPGGDGDREAAVARLRQAAPASKPSRDLWQVLATIVAEMWRGTLEMVEVESEDRLQGLKIKLPESREEAVDLEASAKLDLQRRTNIGWRAHRWRRRGRTFQSLMDMHVDENGCKIADSEPEEEREGEVEEEPDGPVMAATWPPSIR